MTTFYGGHFSEGFFRNLAHRPGEAARCGARPGGAQERPRQRRRLLERVQYLALLNPESEALREALRLQEDSPDRAELLLVLAQVFHCQHRWHEAAVLQEEALQLATTRAEEADVRHHIGRRLFNEARYRDAAAEFQWASDLYRASGRHELAERSRQAMERSRELLNQA